MNMPRFEGQPIDRWSYTLGFVAASMVFLIVGVGVTYLVGFSTVARQLRNRVLGPTVVSIPEPVLTELTRLGGGVGELENPTNLPEHRTPLVQPHAELGYVLKANADVSLHTLRVLDELNFDPPVLFYPTHAELSNVLQQYLQSESRVQVRYTTTASGHRTTLPAVQSDRRILVVGDSVGFGVGVNDAETFPSYLQQQVGETIQVVNASVGGYHGAQAVKAATRYGEINRYDALIYVACENDFYEDPEGSTRGTSDDTARILRRFTPLREMFGGRILVVLHTYMEYNAADLLTSRTPWPGYSLSGTDALRQAVARLCQEFEFGYLDWSDVVWAYRQRERSIFSPMALYADNCHLSPLGNRLLAEHVQALMRSMAWPLKADGPHA